MLFLHIELILCARNYGQEHTYYKVATVLHCFSLLIQLNYVIYGTVIGFFFRAQLTLDETGDVVWTVPEAAELIPLFSCETYEVFSTSLSGVVIRFGAYAGHVIEFRVRILYH